MKIYLNRDWDFYFDNESDKKEQVSIPHTVKETPFNSFDESIYRTVCRYEKEITIPDDAAGKRLILHFEGAAHKATIYVNHKELYTSCCGYSAFDVDITEAVAGRDSALIAVVLDTRESLNQPPFGNVIDYMTYGGIYRDVWLEAKAQVYIKSTYHRYIESENRLESKVVLEGIKDEEVNITTTVLDAAGCKISEADYSGKTVAGPEGMEVTLSVPLKGIVKWDIDNPVLYTVSTSVTSEGNSDTYDSLTGFRTVEWKADGLYLNGRKIKIRGINRHQSYPHVGYAMPDSVQIEDVDIIKHELGMNAVRTSHYPQSQRFIEACDRSGLLVFTEVPGWQHLGDEDWKKQVVENTRDMVIQYRNHPSIILWGVRVNESMDDDELYRETNRVAHELAPGIATGGVRFLQKSNLLEDVYTYNDFLYNGKTKGASPKKDVTPDMNKAYLVSEYNGHMFPTKPWDDETHRVEHALRHATVLNAVYGEDDVAGAFAWCMFDYNTHRDFGSGDRICYHGLMDMYRNPKLAAALYRSQSDEEPVLTVGSDMNIGEYPGGDLRRVYVFTNLDSVKLYKNGKFIREFYPDRGTYGNLPHPPVIIDDFIGELLITEEGYSEKVSNRIKKLLNSILEHGMNALPLSSILRMGWMMAFNKMTIPKGYELYSKYVGGWGDSVKVYEFVGMKDGEEKLRVTKSPTESLHMEITHGKLTLNEERSYDASSVRIRIVNQNGSTETYINETVELETTGAIRIMGPTVITLRGGMGGTYVQSTGSGEGTLTIKFRDEKKDLVYRVEGGKQ